MHSEDHLIAEPPGDDPSQWMWEWCAHHPDPNGCRTCWKVLYNSRAGDVINKGVKFTGRQNPLLWWSATIPHWKQGIFVDPPRNIREKVGQIWAGTRNMRGTGIQLGWKLDFWWHVVVILAAVYLKFQKKITCLLPTRELIRVDVYGVSRGHGEHGLFPPVYLCFLQVECSSPECQPTLRNVICDCISCPTHPSKLSEYWQSY